MTLDRRTGIPAWFERRFGFDFPAELLPNLLSRLRGTPARLEETLAGRTPASLTAGPEGKWSPQEHAGHLLQLEPLWLARVGDFEAGSAGLTPTDLRNRATDEARFNERPLAEILEEFRAARGRLLERVAGCDASAFTRTIPHPRLLQPMRLVDHLYFVAEHDDHHLAGMWELLG